jgi:hypothetical protein
VAATDALTAHGAFFSQAEAQGRPVQWLVLARLDHQTDSELCDSGIVARARQQYAELWKEVTKKNKKNMKTATKIQTSLGPTSPSPRSLHLCLATESPLSHCLVAILTAPFPFAAARAAPPQLHLTFVNRTPFGKFPSFFYPRGATRRGYLLPLPSTEAPQYLTISFIIWGFVDSIAAGPVNSSTKATDFSNYFRNTTLYT